MMKFVLQTPRSIQLQEDYEVLLSDPLTKDFTPGLPLGQSPRTLAEGSRCCAHHDSCLLVFKTLVTGLLRATQFG